VVKVLRKVVIATGRSAKVHVLHVENTPKEITVNGKLRGTARANNVSHVENVAEKSFTINHISRKENPKGGHDSSYGFPPGLRNTVHSRVKGGSAAPEPNPPFQNRWGGIQEPGN